MPEPSEPEGRIPDLSGIGPRLALALSNSTLNGVAARTKFAPQTVRKFLRKGKVPTLEFVLTVSHTYGLSLDWILTGRGMMHEEDYVRSLLRTATTAQLAAALADRLSTMNEGGPKEPSIGEGGTRKALPLRGEVESKPSAVTQGDLPRLAEIAQRLAQAAAAKDEK